MSPRGTARFRGAWRRLRLGTRLALGLGVLSLLVFAVVGTALTTYMRDYLERQQAAQLKLVQVVQSKDAAAHGTVRRQPYYGWYTAVYDVSGGAPVLRRPAAVPADTRAMTALAAVKSRSGHELLRTVTITGEGTYRLRACEVEPGVVLVSAAPMADIDATVRRLVTVQVVAFAVALLALVVIGRALLRRGLQPLSDMAHTAQGIASHDLTESAAGLPLRADGPGGGPEVEELRTAFNTMLEHIDDALAVRARAEQRLRRFVADASHELRTPLMSVRGYADLFQYAAANAPQERDRHLARLRAEAARMGVLLDDLLLLARLDAAEAETPLRREDADLAELVRQAADAFRAAHPDHPLTITPTPATDPPRTREPTAPAAPTAPAVPGVAVVRATPTAPTAGATPAAPATPVTPAVPATPATPATAPNPATPAVRATPAVPAAPAASATPAAPAAPADPATPATPATPAVPVRGPSQAPVVVGRVPVWVDPVRIRQVLDNLLTNAAVHTPPGTGVSVALSVSGGVASVRVADAGPGVPEADRERVFDRFYRVDKARSRDRGGSGLGLAVARSLMRAHGGSVDLEPGPGATVFRVTVPLGTVS
ncbi:sensor histidine kinase [Streptomyces sp. NPDC047000]|uniref:sensor histidine kinase n=1 Tax=Streptomyces sp. NPDC047000 TaxID=3155474 RepID=UPI0033E47E78